MHLRFDSLRGYTYEAQSAIEDGSQFGGSIVRGLHCGDCVNQVRDVADERTVRRSRKTRAGARTRSYVSGSSQPGSEKPSIDSTFA